MRAGRLASAACIALALAMAPGAVRLLPDHPTAVDRPVPLPVDPAVAATASEVAIVPPTQLAGPVAPAAGPAPTFARSLAATEGEVFALLIGIDDYPGRSADLSYAVADVDTTDAALAGFGVPAGHRVVLRDGQARRADVVAAVQSLAAQGGPGSTLVLGYAGHVRKVDADTEELVLADGGSITDAELASLLAPAREQRMWFLLATCFAGGFTEVLAPGRVLTGAADSQHLAYESPALGASFLVHYLVRQGWLQGLAGPSVQDAFAFADGALARDHPERRPVQLDEYGAPMLLGAGDPTAPATSLPPAASPQPTSGPSPAPPPPTTAPPRPSDPERDGCLLGLLCSR